MSKKRKKYLVTKESEAYACSLVTSPAVEELFVSFSEDKPIVEKFADEKKHMVTGVVAIPNKPIYRRNDKTGEEFDIVFSAEAIEGMAKDFLKNYHQFDVTLQHKEDAEGVHLVEQWIKQDPYRDKSAVIGLSEDLPVGSWIQTYYVDSNDVWQRIESGELRGFSLECLLGLEEFESQINNNENNDNTMIDEMSLISKIKDAFKEVLASVSMSKVEEENVIEPIAAEDLSEQTPTEPTPEPQPTEAPKAEETVVETPADAAKASQNPSDSEPQPTEAPQAEETVVETPAVEQPKDNHLEELINSLKEEIKTLKDMNSGLSEKVKDLEKQPSAAPININAKGGGAQTGVESSTYQAWREQMRAMY